MPGEVQRYMARIPGPLMDRIDIHIEVPAVNHRQLSREPTGEQREAIRERVNRAPKVQLTPFEGQLGLFCNSQMESKDLRRHCPVAQR